MTIAMPDRAIQVDSLLALSREDFHMLVRNNLGQEAPAHLWPALADPRVARRTYTTLTGIYGDLCSQMSERAVEWDLHRAACRDQPDGRAEWFRGLNEYNAWKKRSIGFKRILTARMAEIKEALPAAHASMTAKKAESGPQPKPMSQGRKLRLMSTIFELGWAIREHMDQCADADVVPEPHDTALWDALDRVLVQTEDGPITVARMLNDVASKPGFVPPSERDRTAESEGETADG